MKTALVIDDHKGTADSLCQMLEFLGLKAVAAYGPRLAFIYMKETIPDIIFLDINMPGVDGFEILAYLRRFPQFDQVPVVFVSSEDQPETIAKANSTDALLFLVKPPSIDQIEDVLKKASLMPM